MVVKWDFLEAACMYFMIMFWGSPFFVDAMFGVERVSEFRAFEDYAIEKT